MLDDGGTTDLDGVSATTASATARCSKPRSSTPTASASGPCPASSHPWARLVAVETATGEIAWEVPLGWASNELLPESRQRVGSRNVSGPIVTAGGLVFIGATAETIVRISALQIILPSWDPGPPPAARPLEQPAARRPPARTGRITDRPRADSPLPAAPWGRIRRTLFAREAIVKVERVPRRTTRQADLCAGRTSGGLTRARTRGDRQGRTGATAHYSTSTPPPDPSGALPARFLPTIRPPRSLGAPPPDPQEVKIRRLKS